MRFFTKVLHDMGMVDFVEPMRRLLNQGQVINQGKAMSKSLGNGVDLGAQIDEFGVDADPADGGLRRAAGGGHRLGRRVAGRLAEVPAAGLPAGRRRRERTRGRPDHRRRGAATAAPTSCWPTSTHCIEAQRFNVVVARIMELVNATRKAIDSGAGPADPAVREAAEVVTVALSLIAPYIAEEMWEALGHEPSVAEGEPGRWSRPSLLVDRGGDLRGAGAGQGPGRLEVPPDIAEDELRELALADEGVVRSLAGREIAHGDRPGPQAGQHRAVLIVTRRCRRSLFTARLIGSDFPPSLADEERVCSLGQSRQSRALRSRPLATDISGWVGRCRWCRR